MLKYCLAALCVLSNAAVRAENPAPAALSDWQKPAWLTDTAFGIKEGFDNNVLLVSGDGMRPHSSWITTISPRLGFDFAPLLGGQSSVGKLTLSYTPDFNIYHNAPDESYNAHKIGDSIKGRAGAFSFSLDNAFLFNDGNENAPTYALNQAAGGNQNDKFRNFWATAAPRERRKQIQDRGAVSLQYDWNKFFIRPTASLLYYDLMTDWHNPGAAPFKGYQDYPDRKDVNGGSDFGYRMTPALAVTLGYRYGYQYQQQLPPAISSDQHHASSHYQRVLLGLEGKPLNWLTVKLLGGPDFRDYNRAAPVNDFHPVTYYGEASLAAALPANQTLAFNYKQWRWVGSTGVVPYFESSYALAYHWAATQRLGLDLCGKMLEADCTVGNDNTGGAPSLRDDREFSISAAASYAFTSHLGANIAYAYNLGDSVPANLPATLEPGYRNFQDHQVSLGVQWKF